MFRVLVVDDDADLRLSVCSALQGADYWVDQAQDGEEAVTKVRAGEYNLVLMDVNMPKMTGIEALKEVKNHDSSIIVIILTAFSNVRDAVEATRVGAYNYLEKPIKSENLVYMIDRALKAHNIVKTMTMSAPIFKMPNGTQFIGQSNEMKKIFDVIDKLSKVDTPVLIRGESGTGKELVANALHAHSTRKDNRFVAVNCSAIPENLIESEFFGHEKGSFTGADSRKIGKFQYADGGTLFLDEIGDISAAMQVKLLRVLQEKRFTPVGSNREIEVSVRIVAATNRNLEEMIKKGEFREDLFYRLNVLPIYLPPLRERTNDIEHLAYHFIDKFNQNHHKAITCLNPSAMDALKRHQWPGNIRELENVIEHAFVIESSNQITLESLPLFLQKSAELSNGLRTIESGATNKTEVDARDSESEDINEDENDLTSLNLNPPGSPAFKMEITTLDFQASKEEFEKLFLVSALKSFNGRINKTALHANIPKKTLLRKLEKYGINARDYTI